MIASAFTFFIAVSAISFRPAESFELPSPPSSYSINSWRSEIRTPTAPTNTRNVVKELCQSSISQKPNTIKGESGLAFLFVSQQYADNFEDIVSVAHQTLGSDYTLLSIVGGGVIGDGIER